MAELWRRRPLFHIIVSVMSLTNLEVLRMLPWRKTTYDGLPTQRMLGLTFLVTFCEDVPQLILQFAYIFHGAALLGDGGRFAHKDRSVQSTDGVGSGSASSPMSIAEHAASAASASVFSSEAQ